MFEWVSGKIVDSGYQRSAGQKVRDGITKDTCTARELIVICFLNILCVTLPNLIARMLC